MKVEKIDDKNKLVELIKTLAQECKEELQEEAKFTREQAGQTNIKQKVDKVSEPSAAKKLSDPLDVKLNANDGTEDGPNAITKVGKAGNETKKGKESSDDPIKVKVEEEKDGGSDEKISTAVEVKAGSAKGGKGVTAGQAAANFTSKESGPKKAVSDPFLEAGKKEVNSMDKLVNDGAKTYVEAGAEKGGADVTAGQHKAVTKERAPKSDTEKRIADAIQLKESYKKSELFNLIEDHAKKLASKILLEDELNRIEKELGNL